MNICLKRAFGFVKFAIHKIYAKGGGGTKGKFCLPAAFIKFSFQISLGPATLLWPPYLSSKFLCFFKYLCNASAQSVNQLVCQSLTRPFGHFGHSGAHQPSDKDEGELVSWQLSC